MTSQLFIRTDRGIVLLGGFTFRWHHEDRARGGCQRTIAIYRPLQRATQGSRLKGWIYEPRVLRCPHPKPWEVV